jgi:hypothetical protein
MKRILLLLVGSCALLQAQAFYSVNKTTTTSSSAEVITIQQPNSGASKIIRFVSISIACSADCTYTIERNGSAATAASTPITPSAANPGVDPVSTVLAFSNSDATVGTVVTRDSITAGGFRIINLSYMYFRGIGNNQNLTVRTGSFTGTTDINIGYTEGN